MGAKIKEICCPRFHYGLLAYFAPSEASANLTVRAKSFGLEVKRHIMIGNYVLSAGSYDTYYLKEQKVCSLIKQYFNKAFETVDILVDPTSPTTAFDECSLWFRQTEFASWVPVNWKCFRKRKTI